MYTPPFGSFSFIFFRIYFFISNISYIFDTSTSLFMDRKQLIDQLKKSNTRIEWDCIVIGGGATGLGIAVDAASRGYSTVLLEQADFAKATSSRSMREDI